MWMPRIKKSVSIVCNGYAGEVYFLISIDFVLIVPSSVATYHVVGAHDKDLVACY